VRQGGDLADRRDRAGDVGLVRDRDDPGTDADELVGAAEIQAAAAVKFRLIPA